MKEIKLLDVIKLAELTSDQKILLVRTLLTDVAIDENIEKLDVIQKQLSTWKTFE